MEVVSSLVAVIGRWSYRVTFVGKFRVFFCFNLDSSEDRVSRPRDVESKHYEERRTSLTVTPFICRTGWSVDAILGSFLTFFSQTFPTGLQEVSAHVLPRKVLCAWLLSGSYFIVVNAQLPEVTMCVVPQYFGFSGIIRPPYHKRSQV